MVNFFKKKPTIEVFVRHCYFSSASQNKARHSHFDRYKCYQNLVDTLGEKKVRITFFLDTFYQEKKRHFLLEQKTFPVIEIKEGTEAGSFLRMLEHVSEASYDDETIIYFLEDDYLHRTGWANIIEEGLGLPGVDYLTLFDHRDKYFLPVYQDLQSKIYHTESCHWRTTPSTTNTYAMRYKTLLKHLDVHHEFSKNRKITADHEKFCRLREMGAELISSLPGWATHAEPEFASPCFNWDQMFFKK